MKIKKYANHNTLYVFYPDKINHCCFTFLSQVLLTIPCLDFVVEHLTCKQNVVVSSPALGTQLSKLYDIYNLIVFVCLFSNQRAQSKMSSQQNPDTDTHIFHILTIYTRILTRLYTCICVYARALTHAHVYERILKVRSDTHCKLIQDKYK